MPHTLLTGRYVKNWDALTQPGDFCFSRNDESENPITYIQFLCPCGKIVPPDAPGYDMSCYGSLPLYLSGEQKPTSPPYEMAAWEWNGDRQVPTLQPSIRKMQGCKWHGYLTAGVWTPCSDSGN